jgi:hypothetical protein
MASRPNDFLTERTFVVKINGVLSSLRIVLCGVPQGGVLSPTLFSIYINTVPLADGQYETTLLFADDIVYRQSFKFKHKNALIPNASTLAVNAAQEYLNKLEYWMNQWRLTLAPRKCAYIIFSKSRSSASEDLELKLYNESIPFERNPKFLGIVFDHRLTFDCHMNSVIKKVNDRLNVLKILSYDKSGCINEHMLVRIYMSLVRSVLDYCCITSTACSKEVTDKCEVIQNSALRIIFKVSLYDHISIETLLARAGITSIARRHETLLERYYEKCLISSNPLIMSLFEEYKEFKRGDFLRESLAIGPGGVVNLESLNLIRLHNKKCLDREIYATTLCKSTPIVRDLLLDNYDPGSAVR